MSKKEARSGAKALVESLEKAGVEVLFGYPGGAVLDIFNDYPFDGIYFGDDWGQQKGLIMGPDCWRTFIKPRLAQMYQKIRNAGKYVSQQCCRIE